jgi:octaprenyl-diphosphate synthase
VTAPGVDRARGRHRTGLEAVRDLLSAELDSEVEGLRMVADHLLASGGKRLRPLLCLLAAEAVGADADRARVLGAAVELTHAASLCHDDVLDGGEVRRGRATVRVRFGDAMSLLLGDVCLARALGLLARHGLPEAASTLSAAVVVMAEGEVRQASTLLRAEAGVEEYLAVAEAKTGALLGWSVTLGGTAEEAVRGPLAAYGRALARAYQITDDLIDLEAAADSGKATGQDLSSGRPSLPILLASAEDDELGRRVRAALEDRRLHDLGEMVADLRVSPASERARTMADREAARAEEALGSLPPCDAVEDLRALARFAVARRG